MDLLEKKPRIIAVLISFSEANFEGTSQAHNDTLVVTYRIWRISSLKGHGRLKEWG